MSKNDRLLYFIVPNNVLVKTLFVNTLFEGLKSWDLNARDLSFITFQSENKSDIGDILVEDFQT